MGRRGRRRKHVMDEHKEIRRYWKLIEKAESPGSMLIGLWKPRENS